MSEKLSPTSKKPRIPAAVILSSAAFLVVAISFTVSKKVGRSTSPQSPIEGRIESAAQVQTQGQAAPSGERRDSQPSAPSATSSAPSVAPQAHTQVTEHTAPVTPPAECWGGKFTLRSAKLSAVQKESLGERSQKIHLNELFERLSVRKINEAQLCVRAGGHALPFEKDTKDPSVILVRGGTGRIHEKSNLEVSYCLKAEDCAPCKIKKDSFEDALLGESEADAQANADEDVTQKLSAEVRRELARLENESKPAAVDAWELQSANTRCGRG